MYGKSLILDWPSLGILMASSKQQQWRRLSEQEILKKKKNKMESFFPFYFLKNPFFLVCFLIFKPLSLDYSYNYKSYTTRMIWVPR